MALRQLYACHEEFPDNKEISYMVDDLMRSFAREEENLSGNFRRTSASEAIKELEHPYTQHAFLGFKSNEAFFKRFDSQIERVENEKASKKSRRKKPAVKIENIDKIVVVNPMYKKVDVRKRQKVRHIEAEEKLLGINDKINLAARKLDLKTDIINMNILSSSQVAAIQNNSILNDWIDEHMRSEGDMVSPIYNEVAELATQYKTDHFVWLGTMTLTHRRHAGRRVTMILGSAIVPAVAPLLLPTAFSPKGKTLYFALAFNVRTQAVEVADVRQMNMKDTNVLMQSNIYYTLFRIKNLTK
jgi:beta-barrel assembly-enhancing protease